MNTTKTQPFTRDQFKHWTTLEVRWSEVDAYGHVNNVAYFIYFEAARAKYILDTNRYDALMGKSALQVIVNCMMNFRQEVHFPSTLEVGIAVSSIGTTSYSMMCGIFLAGTNELVADGTGKLVILDPMTKRPMPMPEDFINTFEELEQRTISRLTAQS